jgi:hypothetical protein
MKSLRQLLLLTALLLATFAPARADEPDGAAITAIRVETSEVIVTVHVPAGKRRVTLESRASIGRGTWTPRDVKWTDGEAGTITFRLPVTPAQEMLRVREEADFELGLPASFFRGLKTFAPTIEPNGANRFLGTSLDVATPGLTFTTTELFSPPTVDVTPTRAVVESDIWKVDGSTLYFFNQQRGLQVIDVANPDAPVMRGTLPLAVWGEQMYRLPADTGDGTVWLALLAQSSCDQNSEVLLVTVKNGQPTLAGRLPVRGQVRESRLVGDALYIATYAWVQLPPVADPANPGSFTYAPWENRTVVAAFDLANPREPVTQPATELPVFPNAITATEDFLFVATTGSRTPAPDERLAFWAVAGNNAVLVFDISDPHGVVRQAGALPTAGRVNDKFKLGLNGTALAVVSEAGNTGQMITKTNWFDGKPVILNEWVWEPPRTLLETFSLVNPAESVRLAQLGIVTNETVFGTRFDGNRAYIVTFRRVDPLWIVDLTDPANPAIKGELEVPGWSNYLHPLGDRLLAMGVEGGRAALSLFDVKDAANPALLSKAFLGSGWSWSEANGDEKALAVFPAAGLVLVPWSGQRVANSSDYFQGMQLVDLDLTAGSLTARGVVDHKMQARRATLLGDRVLSLSGQELLSVDIANRDLPVVRAELPLAKPAERVLLLGDSLLVLNGPASQGAPATVTLTTQGDPETSLATLPLASLPIAGADVKDGRLYVLQHQLETWRSEEIKVTNQIVISEPVPPREVRVTNEVVTSIPQPAITNLTQVWREITYPPTPTEPGYTTNKWVWRLEVIPQPDVLVTNLVVNSTWISQPPTLKTNEVVTTEWRSIPVPGESALNVIEADGNTLKLAGQTKPTLPTGLYGNLTALWPQPGVVVWTETPAGDYGWPYYRGWGWGGLVVDAAIDIAMPIGVFPGPSLWWPGWFWGSSVRHFLAFDVTAPAAPKLVATSTLGNGSDWNTFSEAFEADGKIFLSHRVSTYKTFEQIVDGSAVPVQTTRVEHEHFLDVVDYADAANPVVRPPVALPGSLAGVSHAGLLLFAQTSRVLDEKTYATTNELTALAYDGISASLVDSTGLSPTWPRPVLVRANGQVLLGRAPATTNDVPTLEAWAITTEGKFAQQATRQVASAVNSLRAYDDVLVADTSGEFLFLAPTPPETLTILGVGTRPCSLGADLGLGDASATAGLWAARGANGLWHVPVQP